MSTQIYTGVLVVHWCPTCGIPYGLDEEFDQRNNREARSWHCPNGHSVMFTKSELERAREERDRERKWKEQERARRIAAEDQAAAAERSARAVRGHLTRIRNRVAAGVCPWCNRTVKQMADHVATKHPKHIEQLKAARS